MKKNIVFFTKSGKLIARKEGAFVVLDFPEKNIEPVENNIALYVSINQLSAKIKRGTITILFQHFNDAGQFDKFIRLNGNRTDGVRRKPPEN